MKKKLFILIALAAFFCACDTDKPKNEQIIGTWSEQDHATSFVKFFCFNEDGTLQYYKKPDTTMPGPDEAGEGATLHYSLTDEDKLLFYGEVMDLANNLNPFAFVSDYSIKGNVLTIDSFAYDGGIHTKFYKHLKLYKK